MARVYKFENLPLAVRMKLIDDKMSKLIPNIDPMAEQFANFLSEIGFQNVQVFNPSNDPEQDTRKIKAKISWLSSTENYTEWFEAAQIRLNTWLRWYGPAFSHVMEADKSEGCPFTLPGPILRNDEALTPLGRSICSLLRDQVNALVSGFWQDFDEMYMDACREAMTVSTAEHFLGLSYYTLDWNPVSRVREH